MYKTPYWHEIDGQHLVLSHPVVGVLACINIKLKDKEDWIEQAVDNCLLYHRVMQLKSIVPSSLHA